MSTYATPEEVTLILQEMEASAKPVTEAEIITAEHDIDEEGLTKGYWRDEITHLKLSPQYLQPFQKGLLVRAVAYQVKFRRVMTSRHFDGAQYNSSSVAGVTVSGTLPYLSPKARQILDDAGLIIRFASDGGHGYNYERQWMELWENPYDR